MLTAIRLCWLNLFPALHCMGLIELGTSGHAGLSGGSYQGRVRSSNT